MKAIQITFIIVLTIATSAVSNPLHISKVEQRNSIGTVAKITSGVNSHQISNYSVRFVPLVSLLAGYFPNFFSRLGQFAGVTKFINTRRFDLGASTPRHNVTAYASEEDNESTEEPTRELLECNGENLGLWPDITNSQRYYKCEVDPRIPTTSDCMDNILRAKQIEKPDMSYTEKVEIPGVKPCFLLSMMKCANGFKYHHRSRICVPDIVFASTL